MSTPDGSPQGPAGVLPIEPPPPMADPLAPQAPANQAPEAGAAPAGGAAEPTAAEVIDGMPSRTPTRRSLEEENRALRSRLQDLQGVREWLSAEGRRDAIDSYMRNGQRPADPPAVGADGQTLAVGDMSLDQLRQEIRNTVSEPLNDFQRGEAARRQREAAEQRTAAERDQNRAYLSQQLGIRPEQVDLLDAHFQQLHPFERNLIAARATLAHLRETSPPAGGSAGAQAGDANNNPVPVEPGPTQSTLPPGLTQELGAHEPATEADAARARLRAQMDGNGHRSRVNSLFGSA